MFFLLENKVVAIITWGGEALFAKPPHGILEQTIHPVIPQHTFQGLQVQHIKQFYLFNFSKWVWIQELFTLFHF